MVSSILPKNEGRIFALVSKERSNKKNTGTNYGLFNIIGIINWLGQKSLKYFVCTLGKTLLRDLLTFRTNENLFEQRKVKTIFETQY